MKYWTVEKKCLGSVQNPQLIKDPLLVSCLNRSKYMQVKTSFGFRISIKFSVNLWDFWTRISNKLDCPANDVDDQHLRAVRSMLPSPSTKIIRNSAVATNW